MQELFCFGFFFSVAIYTNNETQTKQVPNSISCFGCIHVPISCTFSEGFNLVGAT